MPLQAQDIEYILNECRTKLTGASDGGIKTEMFGVMKEFLQDSNSWRENIELMVTAGVQEYALVPRLGGQIIRLEGVFDGFRVAIPATTPDFTTLVVLPVVNVTSVAQAPTDNSLQGTTPWVVCVVKNVTLPTTTDNFPIVPEFVLKVYSTYILDGILGKMMTQSAKSYSNTQLGMYHMKRFRDGIGIARAAASVGNVVGGQRWSFPRQFATNGQRNSVSTAWPGRF